MSGPPPAPTAASGASTRCTQKGVETKRPHLTGTDQGLPARLNTITRYDTADFATRTITLGQSGNSMTINGSAGLTMSGMATITTTLDAEELWTIQNATQLEHSLHLHDVPFQVVEVNGEEPTGVDLGWMES